MKLPEIIGLIERRILINYKIDLKVLEQVLPEPFKPIAVNGYGVGGICLIRLKNIRPYFIPEIFGVSSENAAHRFAVCWNDSGARREGVYIPRRDSSLYLNSLVGGRIFPGIHHYSKFNVNEHGVNYNVSFECPGDSTSLSIDGVESSDFPSHSIFGSLAEVSEFFKNGSIGYSPRHNSGRYEGLELITNNWEVSNLSVSNVSSSFLDDKMRFPEGSVTFDNALLMKNISHSWKSLKDIAL
jgi:hypothetical protein